MDEAQLRVDEVPVVVHALALRGDHVEPAGLVALGELEGLVHGSTAAQYRTRVLR